jgi:hypothetical protein
MMKKTGWVVNLSMIACIGLMSATSCSRAEAQTYSRAQFERWQTELSNWGRWGEDDEIGVLNLITPEKRVQAMALATKGVVVSMQRKSTLMKAPPVQAGTDEPKGVMFYEVRFRTIPPGDPEHNDGFSGEVQRLNPHGGYTHVDAICHNSDGKGHLYNGADLASSVTETGGCLKSGLDSWPNGAIVTRGILVDMTRLKAAHTAGAAVTVADLEAWEKQTGLRVSPGDALFVHNPGPVREGRPTRGGFDLSVLPWMKARGVALTSGFHSVPEASYGGQVDGLRSADHRLVLASMGMPLLDSPELGPLSEEAARQNRWEFMLVVAPHVIPGGTGQLVNPLAMF